MSDHLVEPKKIVTPEVESSEAKLRAVFKKYSRQTKNYSPTEWWDWDSE